MSKKNKADLEQELLNSLDEICEALGLKTVALKSDEDGEAKGVIIGTENFLVQILTELGMEHEEFTSMGDGFVETQEISNKKKESMH